MSEHSVGEPEQVAVVVVFFLASGFSSHVTDYKLYVDGGQSLLYLEGRR